MAKEIHPGVGTGPEQHAGDLEPGLGLLSRRRVQPRARSRRPPLFKVILLNDDYTPMEFVGEVLKSVFDKPLAEATRIMLLVHRRGSGLAGVYPHEIAEMKVRTVEELARRCEYPLKCTMEKG